LRLGSERDIFEEETTILTVLAIRTADEVAYQLDILCHPLEQENEAENYMWGMWGIIIDIARSPDMHEEIHERLVGILQHLEQYERRELKVYGASIKSIHQPNSTAPQYLGTVANDTPNFYQNKRRVWEDLPFVVYVYGRFLQRYLPRIF
jgi:hypothetical protein